MSWLGVGFFGLGSLVILWSLLNAGAVVLRISTDGIWIKGLRDGTNVPWKLVDNISRSKIKGADFLVLEMSDDDRASLYPGKISLGLRKLNNLLNNLMGVKGLTLNISNTAVSNDDLESWLLSFWNDWKVQQGELGLKGKR